MIDNKMAGGAVKVAIRQLNIDSLPDQDWQDLHQEALIALWRTANRFTDEDEQRRYSFGAAVREVKKAFFVQILGRGPQATSLIDEIIEEAKAPEDREQLPLEVVEALSEIFVSARAQRKGRAIDAAFRDVAICALLYAGYNNAGISRELGIPEAHVRRYRSKIRSVLKKKLEAI